MPSPVVEFWPSLPVSSVEAPVAVLAGAVELDAAGLDAVRLDAVPAVSALAAGSDGAEPESSSLSPQAAPISAAAVIDAKNFQRRERRSVMSAFLYLPWQPSSRPPVACYM
jgi:hypothetical protein